jgi:hypothetical protein
VREQQPEHQLVRKRQRGSVDAVRKRQHDGVCKRQRDGVHGGGW